MFSALSKRLSMCLGVAALPLLLLTPDDTERTRYSGSVDAARNRYIGAKACKNCHRSDAKGGAFEHWESGSHAKAFDALASEQAAEVATKLGIDNPQKSDDCLKCHVTAHGVAKREIKRGFDPKLGVQCESCHGPGELHAKTRFKAASEGDADPDAYVSIPADEIIIQPGAATCLECHNDKSPTFKPFCFQERRAEIAHLDPRKERSEEELKAMECQCGEDCKCAHAECSETKDDKEDG